MEQIVGQFFANIFGDYTLVGVGWLVRWSSSSQLIRLFMHSTRRARCRRRRSPFFAHLHRKVVSPVANDDDDDAVTHMT